jgi:hypothetical protein
MKGPGDQDASSGTLIRPSSATQKKKDSSLGGIGDYMVKERKTPNQRNHMGHSTHQFGMPIGKKHSVSKGKNTVNNSRSGFNQVSKPIFRQTLGGEGTLIYNASGRNHQKNITWSEQVHLHQNLCWLLYFLPLARHPSISNQTSDPQSHLDQWQQQLATQEPRGSRGY